MKKYIIGLTLLAMLMVGGCGDDDQATTVVEDRGPQPTEVSESSNSNNTNSTNEESMEAIVIENPESANVSKAPTEMTSDEKPEIEKSDLVLDFETLMDRPSTTAGDIAKFMERHVEDATIGEMDYMVAYLMIYQTAYIEESKDRLFKEKYINALSQDMGGTFDSDYIPAIEDDEVKNFYSHLDKSYLTLVHYEEALFAEMDWNRLADLGLVYSEGLNYVVTRSSDLAPVDYSDYYSLAESIADLEVLVEKEKSVFVKKQLLDLMARWSNYLVAGPDGNFYDYYMIKDETLYKEMVDFAGDYPNTEFGRFMGELVEADIRDYLEISKAYDRYINAVAGKGHQWIYRTDEEDLSSVRRIGYKQETAPEVKGKINGVIQSEVDKMIDQIKKDSPYTIECMLTYDDGKWATVVMQASYQKTETERAYDNKTFSFDLSSGDQVTLETYFNLSSEETLTLLNNLSDMEMMVLPDFVIGREGLILSSDEGDIEDTVYKTITYKDISLYKDLYTFQEVAVDRYDKRPQDQLITELEQMLLSDMTTAEYVSYLEENIGEVSTEEAEKMVEALMIFQTEAISQGNDLLEEEAYRAAYFELVFGDSRDDSDDTDDIETIESNDNPEVDDFFQQLEDMYLRVDNDEDILFLTMDWLKLVELEGDFSEAFQYVVDMRSDLEYQFTKDYYALAKETIRLEVMEDKVKSPFVKAQMEALYDDWVGELLIGTLGQHSGAFIEKSGDYYEEMLRFAEDYSSSALGRFILTLDEDEPLKDEHVDDVITAFFISENLGAKKWSYEESGLEGGKIGRYLYHERGNSERTDRINEVMAGLTKDLSDYAISKSTYDAPNYRIFMFPVYYDTRYVSLYMGIDYQATTAENKVYSQVVTIDMEKGNQLSLETYLDIYAEQAIAIVNNLLGTNYTILPSIYMTETGIHLKANELDTYKSDDQHINRRTLTTYVGLENY